MKHGPDCTARDCYCLATDACPEPDPMCDCGEPAWRCRCDEILCSGGCGMPQHACICAEIDAETERRGAE